MPFRSSASARSRARTSRDCCSERSSFANFFVLTLYVQQVLGWSALKTGVTFVATAGSAVALGRRRAGARDADRREDRDGGRLRRHDGRMLWYTQIPVDASYWTDLLPGYLLVGFALPFTFIPVSIAALAGVQQHEAGLASGLINTAQQIGGADRRRSDVVGARSRHYDERRDGEAVRPGGLHDAAASWAFWVTVGIAVVGLIATLVLIRRDELGDCAGRSGDDGVAAGTLPPAHGPRVPNRDRPGRRHADRPARPRLPRRAGDDPRQARVPEPGRVEQGPDRARDDRSRRARREAEARRHDRRADVGQHRRRARDRGGAEGLPVHLRDARQDEPGEDLDAARLRRRGRDHADGGRARLARVVLLGLVAARGGDPGRLQARPVLEHVEPRGALPHDRAGDLGADRRRARRDRDLGRHRRDDQRRRPLLQGAQARGEDRRRRPRGLGLHGEDRRATCTRTSSRGSARTRGPRRWTATSSTSGCASPTATRSSPRAGSRARRACSSAARPARRSPARSSTHAASGPTRAC